MMLDGHYALPVPLGVDVELPIDFNDQALDTPATLVNLDMVEDNLKRMADFARTSNLNLRPHIKSHKNLYMAKKQVDYGASGICVATASEAEVMAQLEVDLMLAYPIVGQAKLNRVRPILSMGRLSLVADSSQVLEEYIDFASTTSITIPVFIEVDTGMNRSGALPDEVIQLAKRVLLAKNLVFKGIMTHAGHAHNADDKDGIAEIARYEARVMGDLRSQLEKLGASDFVVSAGSTITSPYLKASDGITEIRPGTYIYNDLRTMERWSCTRDQIAVVTLATIASARGSRITVDAGSKTLTTSFLPTFSYGQLREDKSAMVSRISEEHGVIDLHEGSQRYSVGDRISILPIHVCVWMDLQSEIYGVRNNTVVARISNEAMRHSL
jgi:D-serine deaminase-like pyridoxal phosphate-dependent protein